MSGRASRARLLAPSFLVVATALACGGKAAETGAGPDEGTAGNGASGGSTSFNPPPPVCSAAQPQRGSACWGGLSCSYPNPQISCGLPSLPTEATCQSGAWVVNESIYTCNPPMPVMCPPTLPTDGAACPGFPANQCFYNAACDVETATCEAGNWRVARCEVIDGEGGAGGAPPIVGGAPPDRAGAAGEAGAPQGGVGGS